MPMRTHAWAMKVSALILCTALAVLVPVALPDRGAAMAQQLNQRNHAPPEATAKKNRVLTEVRSRMAEEGEASLNKDTVNTKCGPVNVGGERPDADRAGSRNEQVVVVSRDIINICR